MNVIEIRTARDEAAERILAILKELERDTGMFISYLTNEGGDGEYGSSAGIAKLTIDLTLEP